jgi:hypothetical protein
LNKRYSNPVFFNLFHVVEPFEFLLCFGGS